MAEKVRVTVKASGSHPDVLAVQDAMKQVVDVFDLLAGNGAEGVVWRLSFASTNSPFVAEGEAVSLAAGVDVSVIARREKSELVRGLSDLLAGRPATGWRGTDRERIAKRVLQRNMNGVGTTEIQFEQSSPPILITPRISTDALRSMGDSESTDSLIEGDRARKERGSVEGYIVQVGTYRNSPAIKLEGRVSGTEIWCRISKEIEDQIASVANFVDVWERHRVIVKGIIHYDSAGAISQLFASSIERVIPKHVRPSQLSDPNFTGGLSISEYLEKFREGELG